MDKWIAVTDPTEIEELKEKQGELDTPTIYAPNGQLWAVAQEYRAWKELRHDP